MTPFKTKSSILYLVDVQSYKEEVFSCQFYSKFHIEIIEVVTNTIISWLNNDLISFGRFLKLVF